MSVIPPNNCPKCGRKFCLHCHGNDIEGHREYCPRYTGPIEMSSSDIKERARESKMTVTEKFQTVDAAEFGRRIAQVFHDSKSSTALFFIQQAFQDCDDDNGIFWELFDQMLTRIKEAE